MEKIKKIKENINLKELEKYGYKKEDEIYTYANNVVMLSLNYDTYHDMIDYYIGCLHYESIMSIQKA